MSVSILVHANTQYHSGYLRANLQEYVLGQGDVSHAIMIAPSFLVSKLFPFYYFSKHSCMRRNSETVRDIFMQLYRNVYFVRTTCRVQERLPPLLSSYKWSELFIIIL